MNILKYILLLNISLILPVAAFAQLGKKNIILSTGDTVRVVNQRALLTEEDRNFLRKDISSQSILSDYTSNYGTIEEAALDLDRLMTEINTSKSLSQKNNKSLSVRIATRNLRNLKKEQEIQNTWDSIIASEPPMEELTALYKLFDGKPSYFVNDVMVKPQIINRLRTSEILKRSIRTINTATGNPNGEIWYEVTPQAFKRLNIQESEPVDFPLTEPSIPLNITNDATINSNSQNIEEPNTSVKSKQNREIKETENKRSVRKIKEKRAKKYSSDSK